MTEDVSSSASDFSLSGLSCGCAACQAAAAGTTAASSSTQAGGTASSSAQAALSYYISALLPSDTPRWGTGSVGTSASVTYSFPSAAPSYADSDDRSGFAACNANQKAAVRSALALWAAVANITFTEVTDSAASQIRIGTNDQNGVSSGYAYYPGTTSGGDVYFANDLTSMNNPTTLGSFGFHVVLHELGHALGLKHPGDYNAGGGGTEGPYLPSSEDNDQYSVMSYNDHTTMYTYSQTPQLYDIAAIQYLYGANTSYQSGNTTWQFSDTSNAFMRTVWDGGGTDTFDCSAQTLGCTISLVAGTFSSIGGNDSTTTAAVDNVAIAFGATIENATGGSGSDAITGNTADNVLTGGAGSDTLTGGTGNDTLIGGTGTDIAIFSGAYSSYQVSTAANGTTTVTYLSSGGDGTDTLTGIETLRFSDRSIAVGSATTTTTTTTATTTLFSAYAYAAFNADLFSAYGTDISQLAQHYFSYGKGEGRTTNGFDPYAYAANNADLFSAYGTNVTKLIQHYISYGRTEGRTVTGSFDVYAYAANNADVFAAYGTDVTKLVNHYVSYGKNENRTIASFDPYAYAANNADLFAAYGTNISSLIQHYISYGKSEGRTTTGFSLEGYAAANRDVFNALGSSASALIQHYISYGKAEGRSAGILAS